MHDADFEASVDRIRLSLRRRGVDKRTLKLLRTHVRRTSGDIATLTAINCELHTFEHAGTCSDQLHDEHHVLLHVEELCLNPAGKPVRWDR